MKDTYIGKKVKVNWELFGDNIVKDEVATVEANGDDWAVFVDDFGNKEWVRYTSEEAMVNWMETWEIVK